ncbi:hypothetical protein JCM19237_860 [Photobacterium aphoticum]|uniref:Uncharacterized protein n=1 Tax=Photobacterium aphoticum TaxID=754436 RepID=A0A090RJD5_9GAMM|nr:hypothetical protein JCM19237_860 [Photobacterium aphoticum]
MTLFGPRAIRPVLVNDKNTGNKEENEDAMKTRLTCALLMTMMVSPAMPPVMLKPEKPNP